MFKEILQDENVGLILLKKKDGELTQIPHQNSVFSTKSQPRKSMSYGEINYCVYGLPTTDFFNELYGYLQDKEKKYRVASFDETLKTKYLTTKFLESWSEKNELYKKLVTDGKIKSDATKKWFRFEGGKPLKEQDLTFISYARSAIHHPESVKQDVELKNGVDQKPDASHSINIVSENLQVGEKSATNEKRVSEDGNSKKNELYTKEELEASIQIMIEICKKVKETEGANK